MKAFIDTNVVIAAFLTEGLSHFILSRAIAGAFEAVVSDQVIEELVEHMRDDFKIPAVDIREIVRHVRRACRVVPTPVRADKVCRDPDDDAILAAAVEVGAGFLLTGDKDLLVLDPCERMRIVPPAVFVRHIPRFDR